MLRDPKSVENRSERLLRVASIAGSLLLGLVIPGVLPGMVVAQEIGTNEQTKVEKMTADMVAYIPADSLFVVTMRPREILTKPAAKTLSQKLRAFFSESGVSGMTILHQAGIVPSNVEAMAMGSSPNIMDKRVDHQPVFAVRLSKPVDREAIAAAAESQSTVSGETLYEIKNLGSILIVDEKTVLIAESNESVAAMLQTKKGQGKGADSPWLANLARFDKPVVSVVINAGAVEKMIQNEIKSHGGSRVPPPLMQAIVILHDLEWAGAAVRAGGGRNIAGYARAASEPAAGRLAKKLQGLVSLGLGMVRQVQDQQRAMGGRAENKDLAPALRLLPMAEALLKSVEIETKEKSVTLTAQTGEKAAVAVASVFVLPAIQAAREAARRATSQNNLKQIALAFHMYDDKYGYLPPAVIEENGVAHSWRVEILPFLELKDLYKQYRKDEPWNSAHNRKVLAKMPAVYRDPSDDSPANNSSYYLLTSEKPVTKADSLTLFTDKPIDLGSGGGGPKFGDITDGTSPTIMIVEASRDVPWTKPEDIPVDIGNMKELIREELGGNHPGGFQAAFADGAVRFLSENIDPTTFEYLITPAGGEAVGGIP